VAEWDSSSRNFDTSCRSPLIRNPSPGLATQRLLSVRHPFTTGSAGFIGFHKLVGTCDIMVHLATAVGVQYILDNPHISCNSEALQYDT